MSFQHDNLSKVTSDAVNVPARWTGEGCLGMLHVPQMAPSKKRKHDLAAMAGLDERENQVDLPESRFKRAMRGRGWERLNKLSKDFLACPAPMMAPDLPRTIDGTTFIPNAMTECGQPDILIDGGSSISHPPRGRYVDALDITSPSQMPIIMESELSNMMDSELSNMDFQERTWFTATFSQHVSRLPTALHPLGVSRR